ncbi:DNA replication protein psf2 [Lambiella insularis]|nr:DNA replication protein psf2 [Lambiella insularis]
MFSIPEPETSNRPPTVSRRRKFNIRSSSFSLNRQKPPPERVGVVEPYEVAPGTGILNTDATAIIFGYIEREEQGKAEWRKRNDKSKQVDSNKQNRSKSRSPVKKAYGRYKEVHTDDGTDDHSKCTHRQHVEAAVTALQEKRDESYNIWKESQERSKRGRMVSEEDKLQSRGANPRTGIVTPCVSSDQGSVDSGYVIDYLRVHQGPALHQGSWRQDEKGWSLVEDPGPARSVKDLAAQYVPHSESEFRHTRGMRKACRESCENSEWADPNKSVVPNRAPIGCIGSPSVRLRNIPRKKVGSGNIYRDGSADTVVVNGRTRATSVPSQQYYQKEHPRVRIVTPPHGDQRPATNTCRSHSHVHATSSFSGLRPGTRPNPPASLWAAATRRDPRFAQGAPAHIFSSYLDQSIMSYQNQRSTRRKADTRTRTVAVEQGNDLMHASTMNHTQHTPTNEHEADSWNNDSALKHHHPDSLWDVHTEVVSLPRAAINVPIITTTMATTSPMAPIMGHEAKRPKSERLEGSKSVPQLRTRTGDRLNSYSRNLLPNTTMDSVPTTTAARSNLYTFPQGESHHHLHNTVDRSKLQNRTPSEKRITAKETLPSPIISHYPPNTQAEPASQGEAYNGWVVPDDAIVPAPQNATQDCKSHGNQAYKSTRVMNPTIVTDVRMSDQRVMAAGSGNVCRTTRSQEHGIKLPGSILIDGHLDTNESENLRYRACGNEHRRKRKDQAGQDRDTDWPSTSLGKRTFATQEISPAGESIGGIVRSHSLKQRVAEVRAIYDDIELTFSPYALTEFVVRTLIIMVHHVVVTLSPSSPALAVLGESEALEDGEYWAAVKEVLQAGVYLLVLLALMLMAGKAIRVLVKGHIPALQPPYRAAIPLWLALLLKRQRRANILPPAWLSIHALTAILQLEQESPVFSPPPTLPPHSSSSPPFVPSAVADASPEGLPYHWLELGEMLLGAAADDVPDGDGVRRLMRDLREVRMAKMREGVKVLEGGREVRVNGVGGMEVAEGRAFIGGVVDGLRKTGASKELSRKEREAEDRESGLAGADDEEDDDMEI